MKVWIKTLLKANTRVNKPMVTRKTECNYLKGASHTSVCPCRSHYFITSEIPLPLCAHHSRENLLERKCPQ